MSTSLVATLELGLHFPFGVLARARGLHWVFKGTVPPHTSGPLLGRLGMSSRGACADCFASWALSSSRQNGLHASSGPPAFPGELLALSITSIHLQKGLSHQKAQEACLGSRALSGHLTVYAQIPSQDME